MAPLTFIYREMLMRFLPAFVLLLLLAGCTTTRGRVSASTGIRDPYSGSSASVNASNNGVSTSSSGANWKRYSPPIITRNIGNSRVTIDPRSGDVNSSGKLGPFFVTGSDGGVRLRKDADRWEFGEACHMHGVSMSIDSNNGVNVAPPSTTVKNDYVRAGLKKGNWDIVWTGVNFNTALESFDGIAKVRLDASAGQDGFKVSAVPSVKMTLLDVSADYAVHRLAAHAGLVVYVEASDSYVLKSK